MDNIAPEIRKKTMRAIKSSNTFLENRVKKALWNKNLRYRKSEKALFGKPDICFISKKIVIFIDSCFWHGCPEHCRMPHSNIDYWENKILKNKIRDEKVNKYYSENGWVCIRVWEHELKENFDLAISRIEELVKAPNKFRKEG